LPSVPCCSNAEANFRAADQVVRVEILVVAQDRLPEGIWHRVQAGKTPKGQTLPRKTLPVADQDKLAQECKEAAAVEMVVAAMVQEVVVAAMIVVAVGVVAMGVGAMGVGAMGVGVVKVKVVGNPAVEIRVERVVKAPPKSFPGALRQPPRYRWT
jgi:hypothetical protein